MGATVAERPFSAVHDRDDTECAAASEDAALVSRAQAGDVAAFESLYRRHAARVHGVCLRLMGDAGAAEEAVQDAFFQAWRNLGQYRGESAFATWLHRIAVNAALGVQRARRRRVGWLDAFRWLRDARSNHVRTGNPALRMDLESALARLPQGARTVFVLHDVEGHRHDEIAAMLGITAGACKAQLHRARRLLQKELEL